MLRNKFEKRQNDEWSIYMPNITTINNSTVTQSLLYCSDLKSYCLYYCVTIEVLFCIHLLIFFQ